MRARWWRFVAALTHNAPMRLGPAVTFGGRVHARLSRVSGRRPGPRCSGVPTGRVRETPSLFVADRGKRRVPVRARLATPAERTRLWDRLVADSPLVERHETFTRRSLPVVVLEPR